MAAPLFDLTGLSIGAKPAEVVEFAASGTFNPNAYPGLKGILVTINGSGGGGGGGGARVASGTACSGGGGGGGGGTVLQRFATAAELGSTALTITIGAAGTAGAGATSDGVAGGNGGTGNFSSIDRSGFGNWMRVYGGGGGAGGQVAAASGGGGGSGMAGTGGSTTTSAAGAAGTTGGVAGGGGGAGVTQTVQGFGSGAGGCANGSAGSNGGFAALGGNGGSGGGGINATPTAGAGGNARGPGTFTPPDGWTLVLEADAPADRPAAAAASPDRVTRFQAKAALSRMGLLSTAASIASAAGGETLLAWNEAGHFYRSSPLILQFAALLGMDTPQEIDAFFILADTIEV